MGNKQTSRRRQRIKYNNYSSPDTCLKNWKSNQHFFDVTSCWRTISLDPKDWNADLQEKRFTSQFSLLQFRLNWFGINYARHERNIIHPKKCRMPGLTDDAISHRLKRVQPPTGLVWYTIIAAIPLFKGHQYGYLYVVWKCSIEHFDHQSHYCNSFWDKVSVVFR